MNDYHPEHNSHHVKYTAIVLLATVLAIMALCGGIVLSQQTVVVWNRSDVRLPPVHKPGEAWTSYAWRQ